MISGPLARRVGTEPGGVFYLHGDDEHGKDESLRALVEAHLDPGTRDFNLDLLRGSEVDLETLASVLGTPPMMAEWRVVVLRETEALAGSPRARDLLLDMVGKPPPGLALILSCTPPARSKARFYTDLAKQARSAAFTLPTLNELPGWLMAWSRENLDRVLEEDAARALAQAVGANPSILVQELEKLATLVGEGSPITRAAVVEAGTRVPRQNRWDWFDGVAEGRFGDALEGVGTLLAQGESGVGLANGVGTHLLRLGVVAAGGGRALQEMLPGNQKWLTKRYQSQVRHWTLEELEDALLDLLQADRLLKASPMDDEHFIEGWLLARMARIGPDTEAA